MTTFKLNYKLFPGALTALSLLIACGGNTSRPDIEGGSTPKGNNTTGSGGSAQAGTEAATPKVTLSVDGELPSLDTPASGKITGLCTVTPGDDKTESSIDAATVVLSLINADGKEVASESGATVDGTTDTFSAEFLLTDVESGVYTLRCSAATANVEAVEGSADLSFPIDRGPKISGFSPAENAALSSATPQTFEFDVEAVPLADSDPDSAVSKVWVSVKGVLIDANLKAGTTSTYQVTIDFADTTAFPNTPDGETLFTVSASNSRETPITNSHTISYLVDGAGPELAIISPTDGSIIGGTVYLDFSAEDTGSGIDLSTLTVTLNNDVYGYNSNDGRWSINGSTIRFEFESKAVTGSIVQTNVQISAQDNAGNIAEYASALYQRDEKSPLLSLAPPYFREGKQIAAQDYCSHAFHPTGNAVRGDEKVDDLVFFRAVAWDRTNTTTGQTVFHLAGVDTQSVELWIRDANGPILKDTDSDGKCDDIVTSEASLQEMSALIPAGAPLYGSSGTDPSATPAMSIPGIPSPSACIYEDSVSQPPQLCDGDSDLTVVAHHSSLPAVPIVYAINPKPNGPECTGSAWEIPSVLVDYQGWVCAAVRAHDNVGNRGVSNPIALCLDNSQVVGVPACASNLGSAPNCNTGCSAPDDFNPDGVVYRRD